jgi:Tat protein secretion system quality control protein TatD with DNase activity
VQKDVFSLETMAHLATMAQKDNCFAVGECGLDYSEGFPEKTFQLEWFRYAINHNMKDTIKIEKNEKYYLQKIFG